jgi:hypothetical protein
VAALQPHHLICIGVSFIFLGWRVVYLLFCLMDAIILFLILNYYSFSSYCLHSFYFQFNFVSFIMIFRHSWLLWFKYFFCYLNLL